MAVVTEVLRTAFSPSIDYRVPPLLHFNVQYFLQADHLLSRPCARRSCNH